MTMTEQEIRNKTNKELSEFVAECEGKYKKLHTLAMKLADEMDSLSAGYRIAKDEIGKRGRKNG